VGGRGEHSSPAPPSPVLANLPPRVSYSRDVAAVTANSRSAGGLAGLGGVGSFSGHGGVGFRPRGRFWVRRRGERGSVGRRAGVGRRADLVFLLGGGRIRAGSFGASFGGVGGVARGFLDEWEATEGLAEELEGSGARDARRDGLEVVEDARRRREQGEGILEPARESDQWHGSGVGEAASEDARLRRVEEDVRAIANSGHGGGGGAHREGPRQVAAANSIEDLLFGLQVIEGHGMLVDLVCKFSDAAQERLDHAPELSLDREKWSFSVQC
jgi:hypothetical protein